MPVMVAFYVSELNEESYLVGIYDAGTRKDDYRISKVQQWCDLHEKSYSSIVWEHHYINQTRGDV